MTPSRGGTLSWATKEMEELSFAGEVEGSVALGMVRGLKGRRERRRLEKRGGGFGCANLREHRCVEDERIAAAPPPPATWLSRGTTITQDFYLSASLLIFFFLSSPILFWYRTTHNSLLLLLF